MGILINKRSEINITCNPGTCYSIKGLVQNFLFWPRKTSIDYYLKCF